MIIPDIKKKQKNEENRESNWMFLLLGVCILVIFIFFQPKVSSHLFPQKQEYLLNTFTDTIQKQKYIEPRQYWEFREFYSPGYFDFSPKGVDNTLLKKTDTSLGIEYKKQNVDRIFLIYNSNKLISYDLLTKQQELDDIVDTGNYKGDNVLFQNHDTIVYKDASSITVIFLKSIEELKKANGFFDYRDLDKEMLQGKNWVNITKVSTIN